jgi:hypothetical protein
MMELNYLTEVPSSYSLEDTNFAAFVEVTSLIGGRDVVEEFVSCGLLMNNLVSQWRQKNLPCLR